MTLQQEPPAWLEVTVERAVQAARLEIRYDETPATKHGLNPVIGLQVI
jgi:hypothetical protein